MDFTKRNRETNCQKVNYGKNIFYLMKKIHLNLILRRNLKETTNNLCIIQKEDLKDIPLANQKTYMKVYNLFLKNYQKLKQLIPLPIEK